tara:strand:- start:479 stop:826 length:348 start_codon:yes stop_codon:yes gene_type:complete
MKFKSNNPPRIFKVGHDKKISISDMGDIHLEPDEQVTFVTDGGDRHDFCRKNWGFYATPSINSRLKNENFITALVANKNNNLYVMVVEKSKIKEFRKYLKYDDLTVISWFGDPLE